MKPSVCVIQINVTDMDQALVFYRDVLGIAVVDDSHAPQVVVLENDGPTLILNLVAQEAQIDYGRQAQSLLNFQTDDLAATMVQLKTKGVAWLHDKPQPCPVGLYAAFRDPSGNVHEFLEFAPAEPPTKSTEVPVFRGVHTMYYSDDAPATRAFLKDILNLPCSDVGEGWLVFDLPEADMGVHPSASQAKDGAPANTRDISFYCEDIEVSMAALKARGVKFTQPIENQGFGLVTRFLMPGGVEAQLYQPLYEKGNAS